MANVYTSVATAGLGTQLVQAAYDKAVGEELRLIPSMREFVNVVPGNPAMRGSSITLEKFAWFNKAAVLAAKTPLSEEIDVDSVKMPTPVPVTITPQEYGFTVTSTRKLAERVFAPFDANKAKAVAFHMAQTIDSLVQDVMVTGTQVKWGGNATALTDIAASHVMTSSLIRRAVATLRAQGVPTWSGGFYAMEAHPYTILDLREETGSKSWRVPSEYGVSQSEIWRGEINEFEGVRVVQNPTVRAHAASAPSVVQAVQTYIFGANAIAEQVFVEPEVRIAPQTDKLGRFHTIGWYGDLGWAVYEQKALYRIVTSPSEQALLVP